MKIADVKKLKPLDRYLYWIRERHKVYLKKERGDPKPWTDDEIIQRFWFTTPYRENDKVTVWFRNRLREPWREDPRVLFATIAFRWFNLPATADALIGSGGIESPGNLLAHWNEAKAVDRLGKRRAAGEPVFTGAYLVNSPKGKPKLESICKRVTSVWEDRKRLLADVTGGPGTLEHAYKCLKHRYEGLGGFYSYEIVCDLRYTYLCENATDVNDFTNPGPGCVRGIYRIENKDWPQKGNNSQTPKLPDGFMEKMKSLWITVNKKLPGWGMPPFEMREVEHCLCEYDKYERLLWQDGHAKRNYPGV